MGPDSIQNMFLHLIIGSRDSPDIITSNINKVEKSRFLIFLMIFGPDQELDGRGSEAPHSVWGVSEVKHARSRSSDGVRRSPAACIRLESTL